MKRFGLLLILVLGPITPTSTVEARTWYIKADGTGDAPTIQAGTDSCSHGDTVLVAAGIYSWSTQGGNEYGMISILRGSADMVIVSESGPDVTILDGQRQNRIIFFQGETELTVDGFTLTRGEAPILGDFTGGGFAAHYSSPIVRNCIFADNSARNGGAYWYGGTGSPQIIDCLFEHNTAEWGGAIYLINNARSSLVSNCVIRNNNGTTNGGGIFAYNFRVDIEDCVFDENTGGTGGGIAFFNTNPTTVSRCTFYKNSASAGGGIACFGSGHATVSQTIISHGLGGAATNVDGSSSLTFDCSDIFGNSGGDWTGAIAGQEGINGNFSADPRFCLGDENFYLQESSPCATGNHPNGDPCGTIGALGVGCGTVDIEQRTWGAIKTLYR